VTDDDVNDFLEHFGVKGMRWGTRKASSSKSPEDRIRKIDKKINRLNADRIYGGAGLVGYYQKRKPSKRPHAKARSRLLLRGATETAVLLGGSTILMKKMGASRQQVRGGQIAFGLLAA